MSRIALLATDMDRTLLPNGEAPESPGAREVLRGFVESEGLTLAYVTGRRLELVEEAVEEYDLPRPDFILADVGSTLYESKGRSWVPSREWSDWLAENWSGRESSDLARLFEEQSDLRLQEPAAQRPFKLSYYTKIEAGADELRQSLLSRLEAEGLPSQVIYSVDEGAARGLIDILPERSSKRGALEFLLERQGWPLDSVLFAGDSGNDLDVLVSPIPAVLVANADPSLREIARCESARDRTERALHFARGGVLSMNGNYAAGILEGLLHFHPEDRSKLELLAGTLGSGG
jgi:sucrose-6-phosphatase